MLQGNIISFNIKFLQSISLYVIFEQRIRNDNGRDDSKDNALTLLRCFKGYLSRLKIESDRLYECLAPYFLFWSKSQIRDLLPKQILGLVVEP